MTTQFLFKMLTYMIRIYNNIKVLLNTILSSNYPLTFEIIPSCIF